MNEVYTVIQSWGNEITEVRAFSHPKLAINYVVRSMRELEKEKIHFGIFGQSEQNRSLEVLKRNGRLFLLSVESPENNYVQIYIRKCEVK